MALDRQRILSELGNVMNQLKSADCGCMNKLFGDSGQNVAPMECPQTYGGCRGAGCHGNSCGWNQNGSCGEGFHNNQQNMYPCMGTRCNPKMLYADTYGYLNQSLMQPTVKEVYDDLKSISPNNTIMNNPMAKQMGLSNEITGQGGMRDVPDQYQGGLNVPGNMSNNSSSPASNNQTGQFGGMGPQIMNMLGGNIFKQSNTAPQNINTSNTGQLLEPMVIDAPQSPHGKVGVTPLPAPMSNLNAGQAYFSNQPNTQSNMNSQNQSPGIQQTNLNSPHTAHGQHQYGLHSQGIAKFNEMFPGVMKNDLGFDPMGIAIQMNPANQKQAAIDTMYKMMYNNKMSDNNAKQSPYGNMTGNNQVNSEPPKILNAENSKELYQTSAPTAQGANVNNTGQLQTQNISSNQQISNPNTVNNTSYGQSQQVYGALTNSSNSNQQQQLQQPIQYQQQEPLYDPNTGNIINPPTLPTVYEGSAQPEAELQLTNQTSNVPNRPQMIKEPIFPADTSPYVPIRQKYYDYNTLGQPIDRQSAKMYHTPEPPLPQTLSPQPATKSRNDFTKYSNVKATMSKTSLIGNTAKKAASKSQLQQMYNTYKGSHSYSQQNINDHANHGASNSDGKIQAVQNTNPAYQYQRQIPIEKVGGDTVANNQMQDRRHKVEEVIGQIGDVPNTNKINEPISQKVPNPNEMRKGRNGLQDMVYTSYPISAAWSFHGHNRAEPAGYRYR